MAETWTPAPVTSTRQRDPATFSPSPPEKWDTELVITLLPSSQETVRQPTSPIQGLDEQWSDVSTPSMTTDTFQASTNFATTTPLYKSRGGDITNQPELGKSSIFASSVVTATVSEIITETEAATTPMASSSAYDEFKLGLIVTLSLVIGCFAITAISLRIRSRIKKRRLESELIKKRKKSVANNRKPSVKRVTIKMGKDFTRSVKRSNKQQLRRSHSPSLQSRAKIPQMHLSDSMDRNRTLDALLDAGTYPPLDQDPLGWTRGRSKSEVSSRTTLLARDNAYEASEYAYDNPVISSGEEMATEVSMLSEETCSPLQMKIDAEVHHGNEDALAQNASDSDDGSVEKSNCIEGSETESLSDARKRSKLNHYFGMRSTQRNDSKDSGYVESFISQDSLRLRAMASLEEGRALADGLWFTAARGPERLLPRLGNVETSPNISLNRSSSVKSESGCRPIHPEVWPDSGVDTIRQSRHSVPSFPTHYPQYYHQRSRHANLSPYHELYGAPYVSYPSNFQRYSSGESMNDYPSTQSEYGPVPRRNSRALPKCQSYEFAGYTCHDVISPRHTPTNQDLEYKKRAKRFVKRRSLGTQTDDTDNGVDVEPMVQWDYNIEGNLVAKPRENAGMDFIGPIYMAEELEEMSFPNTDCVIEIDKEIHTTSCV